MSNAKSNANKVFQLAAIGLLFLVIGCQTISINVEQVKTKTPVEIGDPSELASIKFDRVGIKIKRGTAIGSYDPNFLINFCVGLGDNIFWNQGRVLARNIEFADLFFNEMKAANFNIIGDPDKLFKGVTDDRRSANYLIGGQLDEIKLNVCDEQDMLSGYPRNTQRGEGSVRVRWQVFSTINRKVVFETTTEGFTALKNGVPGGELVIIHDAFANSVVNLAADEKFVAFLKDQEPAVTDIRNVSEKPLLIPRYPPRKTSITDTIDQTRLSVVTVETGMGHGSGFFITPSLIMTNFHVVSDQQFIRVRLLTGRKIMGEVIRRHPKRDVAIIQVEKSRNIPIPIRTEPLKITEEVYAIGSPILKKLSGTVSKGIVSKFTSNSRGLEDIQADVDIHGGNSGGVLLDSRGNAVGVTYAGYGSGDGFSVGINLFVPIMDAMKKLNLEFKKRNVES